MKLYVPVTFFVFLALGSLNGTAQATDGTMSEAEVETLREAAYVPVDRIHAYEKILDARAKSLSDLLAKRRHIGREIDIHDLLDQFSGITDELTDNLDDYRKRHRDVRKVLPKLLQEADLWSAAIQTTPPDDSYNIVRKVAIDNLKDLRDAATAMGPELDAYFRNHPDALKLEKERMDPARAHAPQ